MARSDKGQVGIEYGAVLVLFLFILVPVLYIGIMEIQISGQVSQARVAVDSIADAADRVYAQGPGATTTIEVYLPPGIAYAYIGTHEGQPTYREVDITLYLPTGGTTDVYALARGNLTGVMPTLPGRHVLVERMDSSGNVNITEVS